VNPWDIFNPAAYNPLDPTLFVGAAGTSRLLEAAAHFPGGPTVLVFLLFWAPVGPGIPAGVLLARHVPLNPAMTFGRYALSDALGAAICLPLFGLLCRAGRHVPALQWIGQRLMRLAMLGTRIPSAADIQERGGGAMGSALFRIATVGFGVDVYHAGMLVAGLPVPRLVGWLSAIAGDLVWFAVLLGASLATAAVVDDDRVVGVVVLVAMIVVPLVAKRVFPALRDPAPAKPAATPVQEMREMPMAEAIQQASVSAPAAAVPLAPTWSRPAERAATRADRLVSEASARSRGRTRAKRR
jgi:hypothetical protein